MTFRRAPDMVTTAEVRRAIDEFLELEQAAEGSGSPLGGQIEAMRQGLLSDDDGHLWRRTQASEERSHRHACLLLVWQRMGRGADGKTDPQRRALQQTILRLQRTPHGEAERYVRSVPSSEVYRRVYDCGGCTVVELGTAHGETRIGPAVAIEQPLRPVGISDPDQAKVQELPDRSLVQGTRRPTYSLVDIAQALQLTVDRVRREITEAHEVWREFLCRRDLEDVA